MFLIAYDRYCAKFRTEKDKYFKFALACLGHWVFALITEITVNMDGISVGISVGYAELSEKDDLNRMFQHAETMMYVNKKNYYQSKGLERRKE